jgi:hypothetical protein
MQNLHCNFALYIHFIVFGDSEYSIFCVNLKEERFQNQQENEDHSLLEFGVIKSVRKFTHVSEEYSGSKSKPSSRNTAV